MGRFQIAFRADDAGLCQGVDEGILNAVAAGLVRNVSIMVPGPNFGWMTKQLIGLSHVEIGLHVCLNCEWEGQKWRPTLPARDVPSLIDADGMLLRTPQALYDRKAELNDLVREAKSQLAVARAHGLTVHYLDEHMGVGWLPGLKDKLRLLAKTEGLIYADDLPHVLELEQSLPDAARILQTLTSMDNATGLVVLHLSGEHSSSQDLSLTDHPDEISRRIAEGILFSDPSFVRDCLAAGVEPLTFSQLAAVLPQSN
jgi:chitin disaccharide deacetylase